MEELLFSGDLNAEQKMIDTEKPMAVYGHQDEIQEVKNRLNGVASNIDRFGENFKKVESKSGRKDEVDKVFSTAIEDMKKLWKSNSNNIYDKVEVALTRGKMEGTDNQVAFIEKYSQTCILDDLREITFERSMAQKCEEKDSTKHTRRRKAKREKVLEKQKAVLLAAAEMSNKLFQNTKLEINGKLDEDTQESTRKYATAKYDAQQEYIDAMLEADKYDYENNVKMARTRDGRRVIDMGKGTSDYFASLSKLSSDSRIYYALQVLTRDKTDVSSNSSHLPKDEIRRMEERDKQFNSRFKDYNEKLSNDANKCFDRLPDLLIALNSDLRPREEEIRGKVKDFKSKGMMTMISFMNDNIVHNPYIMATFRKDIRDLGENQLPDKNKCKELADSILKNLDKKIAPNNANGGNV